MPKEKEAGESDQASGACPGPRSGDCPGPRSGARPGPRSGDFPPEALGRARGVALLALDVDGVLTDGRLYFDRNGNEMKAFCTRDGLGMKALQRFGIKLAIITGRDSRIVSERAAQLDIDFVYQGRDDKLNAFDELVSESGIQPDAICYAGDDWLDIPVLDRVGFSVAPADAAQLVRQRVHWVTHHGGGHGAVREICDLILAAKGLERSLLEDILKK